MIFPQKINDEVYQVTINHESFLTVTIPKERLEDLNFKNFQDLEDITKKHNAKANQILKNDIKDYLNSIGLDMDKNGDVSELKSRKFKNLKKR